MTGDVMTVTVRSLYRFTVTVVRTLKIHSQQLPSAQHTPHTAPELPPTSLSHGGESHR